MRHLLRCPLAAAIFLWACGSDPLAPSGTLVIATARTIPADALGRVEFLVACPQSTTASLIVSLSTAVIN
jgi:hypothetical protein